MSESPFQSLSYALVSKGYRVFPVAPGQKYPALYEDKIWKPMHQWHHIYSNRIPTEIELDFWRLYYPQDAGIGLLMGAGSGIVGLDFDYDLNGLHRRIEDLIEESPVKKCGAKGYTAFYRYRGESSKSWHAKGPDNVSYQVLDLLSDGRQTVLPPSLHPNGMRYEWWNENTLETFDYEKLPYLPNDFQKNVDNLCGHEHVNTTPKSDRASLADMEFGPTSLNKARQALQFIDPDVGYSEWVEIGMALKDYFGDDGLELWDDWSRSGSKYKANETTRKWKSFRGGNISIASLFHHAQERGFVNVPEVDQSQPWAGVSFFPGGNAPVVQNIDVAKIPEAEPELETWEIAALERKKIASGAVVQPGRTVAVENSKWADHEPGSKRYLFTEAPGLVGKISRWMTATAIYPDPILNMACAIAMMGVVKSHKVQTETGLRSNLYTMGIAPSGTGKDHARKCVAKLLKATDQAFLLSGQPASSSGLFTAVYKSNGRSLILMDEFGKVLSSMTAKNASNHIVGVPTLMMEFFSSAGSVFLGNEYANRDGKNERIDIEQPCLNVYATTTPEPLYGAMSSTQAIDGFLSRWLLFETKDFPVEPTERINADPPENILLELEQWRDMPNNMAPESMLDFSVKPRIVRYSATAEKMARAFTVDMRRMAKDHLDRDTGMSAIFTRTAEHAAKLALVAFDGKFIDEEVYDWACQLAFDRSLYLANAVRLHISDSKYESDLKKIMRIIERAGIHGISTADLAKKCTTLRSKDRLEIVNSLMQAEMVEYGIIETVKRPSTVYRSTFWKNQSPE